MKINKIIKKLVISDLALLTGIGFITPIFAIFVTQKINGGNIQTAGFAAFIYLAVQSIVMVPFGKYLDKTRGEKDDILFIIIGNTLIALAAFGYIFSYSIWHIYIFQAIYGLGLGMNLPAYTAIFTKHIDKGKEAFDWAFRGTLVTIGGGVAAALGGIIAYNFGFTVLFISVGIFIILSALIPILIIKEINPREQDHREYE